MRMEWLITFFIASQFFNIAQRMDLFLLSYFLSKSPEVGYYGLAQKIILTVTASIASITQVLSPQFSKVKTKPEIIKEFKHGAFYLLIPVGLFILLFFTPNWVFYIFFTEKFAQTAVITKALSLPYIIFTLLNLPFLFILYTIKKPGIILLANIVFFAIVSIGCYYLIPVYKIFAPPYVIAIGFFVSLLIGSVYSFIEYKKI